MVRRFISLNYVDKINVAKTAGVYGTDLLYMYSDDKDKAIFKKAKENNCLDKLYKAINEFYDKDTDANRKDA